MQKRTATRQVTQNQQRGASINSHRYDKKLQDIVEEVNTKTGIGYKIIEDSDRPNKLKVLYQQTVHLLEQ